MNTVGSLFAGTGGFDLGFERAGFKTVWQVEKNAYCRRVLRRHFPDADRRVTDVRFAGARNLLPVDVICGGFPCQDISNAGLRAGIDGARSGLWFHMCRVIREFAERARASAGEIREPIVVVENAYANGSHNPVLQYATHIPEQSQKDFKLWRGRLHELGAGDSVCGDDTYSRIVRELHGVPARVDRLRALGNAVVPQIPELIARRLKEVLA